MGLIVVDSSVAIKWFLDEVHSPEAHQILRDYRNGIHNVVVPDLLYAEVGNILWKKQDKGLISAVDCQHVLREMTELLFPVVPINRLTAEALSLAVAYKRTVYDMLYVALAEREGCPLITADERLVNAVSYALPNVVLLSRYS